ncbi:MAG: TIR domain-containing protein [Clostridia bacterium]|nr:TIR domain-containing protein [Clostridia bacterium]
MIDNSENRYDAFISYRHKTGFYMANLIYEKLTYNGYSVFLDKNLKSNDVTYDDQIKSAINKSSNFIMIIFPGDFDGSADECIYMCNEATWAIESGTHLVPVFCDGLKLSPEDVPEEIKPVIRNQGIEIHKDYAFDNDLDRLCDEFLVNVNPLKPLINTNDFFEVNLNRRDLKVKSVDLAFHAGQTWLYPNVNKPILQKILRAGIHVRVIINTPEAAEIVASHMRD